MVKKKKIGIMQPYFFPYIGYWQLINLVDEYVVYDDVNYIKKGWINRNKIFYSNEVRYINLLLNGASQNKKINEISIINNEKCREDFLKVIYYAYHSAPEYSAAIKLIEKIIYFDGQNLAFYLLNQLEEIASYLEMNTKFILSSSIHKDSKLKGEEKIIQICKLQEVDTYINAIGGRELYSVDNFRRQGIDIRFLECNSSQIKYYQNDEHFHPNLSILDVMMYNKVNKIREYLTMYTLIE